MIRLRACLHRVSAIVSASVIKWVQSISMDPFVGDIAFAFSFTWCERTLP